MPKADISSVASLEVIYSRADFEEDSRLNSQSRATVHHGLKILSAPDETGSLSLIRASQHVGEEHAPAHSFFICPFLEASVPGYFTRSVKSAAGLPAPASPYPESDDPYRRFLEEVFEAADLVHFPPPIAAERLKAFLGG